MKRAAIAAAIAAMMIAACSKGGGGKDDDPATALATSDDRLDAAYAAIIADPKAAVPIFAALDRKPVPGDKKPFEHDPAKRRAAEAKAGAALVAPMLAVAQMTDHPDAARDALDYLGEHAVAAARPIALAILADANAVPAPRAPPADKLVATALRLLRALGADAATADAVFRYAVDPRATDDRSLALDVFAAIAPAATLEQQTKLTALAAGAKRGTPADAYERAFLMISDGNVAWPTASPDFHFDLVAAQTVRACGGAVGCLAALVETGADRAYDKVAVDKALRTLALHPDPAARGPLLAAVDEFEDPRVFDEVIDWLPFAIPGSCPECVARMTAAVARHPKAGVWQHTEIARAIDRFRAHGTADSSGGDMPPRASGGVVDVIAGEHRALARDAAAHAIAAELFAPTAIGVGVAATDVASGAAPVRELMAKDFATPLHFEGTVRSHRGGRGAVVWDSQMFLFDDAMAFGHLTQVIVDGRLQLWVYSHGVDTAIATAAAKARKIPSGGALAAGDPELGAAAKAMLASTAAFTAALAPDAYVLGSDPTAESIGPGDLAKVLDDRPMVVRDVHAERVADDVAGAVANVERAGAPMRVALVLVKAAGGWQIVQAQWSYGLPIPGVQ